MKRYIAILFCLIFICGCSKQEPRNASDVTFYYLHQNIAYGQGGSAIASEQREQTGNRRELSYLMAMYLMGPVEEEHTSPLPDGTRILCSIDENSNVLLELSDSASILSDSEFSLACACLSLTCFDITNTTEVTVICGERKITLREDTVLLTDDITFYSNMEDPK